MTICASLATAIDDVALGAPVSHVLATHLATCADCATQLERRRALAQRIDIAVAAQVRADPPTRLSDRVAARAAMQQPRSWRVAWLALPAGVTLAAAVLLFFLALDHSRRLTPATNVATLEAWRSPTASLLITRGNVFDTPFTLRDIPSSSKRSHSSHIERDRHETD